MAFGGGTFSTQNKVIPGTYVNFVATSTASSTMCDRGFVAMGLNLNWGVDGEIVELTNEDFIKNSNTIFGYSYTDENLKGIRDLFLNANTLYFYRLNSGTSATCVYATAKYSGTRGNDIKIVITENSDNSDNFDVTTLLDNTEISTQTVNSGSELIDNDYVIWNKSATLNKHAGLNLADGTNGAESATTHQKFLDKIESYSFNILGLLSDDDDIKSLYVSFVKLMRDDIGLKFQLVLHDKLADYEGVISIKNQCLDGQAGDTLPNKTALVYWVSGISASCSVNQSCLNKEYDGEFTIEYDLTQTELISTLENGYFILHKVGKTYNVLSDNNCLTTFSDDKSDVFSENQTIRVLDQLANDIALLFKTKYIGIIPNDTSGRISLWSDIVKLHESLQEMRAIENFSDTDVVVSAGDDKNSVVISDCITVIGAMSQIYMTVSVS